MDRMSDEPTIKAIPTKFKGYTFRSRLEARWAVFFDALGLRWEYEPEGFDLPGVGWYLPDFHLPDLYCWIEIKGEYPSSDEEAKVLALANVVSETAFIFFGEIPYPTDVFGNSSGSRDENAIRYCLDGSVDYGYRWCICEKCGEIGIEYSAQSDNIGCCGYRHSDSDGENGNHPSLMAAFKAARSARFEHGANGR